MEQRIPQDQMTPRERMEAFSQGLPMDRIPCCPFNGESFAPHFGYSIRAFNHNPEIIADTVIKTFRLFGADNCSIGPGLQGLPEAMGTTLFFPEYDIPRVERPALANYGEIDRLKVVDPAKDGRLRYYLEALKIVQEAVGKEVCVGNTVGGPFTTAAFLIGTERFLRDIRRQPEAVHQVLEIATASVMAFMDAVMDLGITPGIADPMASCTVISPRLYEAFAMPYTQRCEAHIAKRMGSGGVMHICGHTKGIWQQMVATGITAISLDNGDDLGELRAAVGDKVAVVGNVDPVDIIMRGTPQEIDDAVRDCIMKGKGSPKGFILASGCDIPIGTDPLKVQLFMDAARKHGQLI